MLQQVLKADPKLDDAKKNTITQWVATAVGAATGGETGAAAALDNVKYNYLYHQEQLLRAHAKQQLARCEKNGDCSNGQVASLKEQIGYWDDLDTRRDDTLKSACDLDGTSRACLAAVTDALKAVEYLRDPIDPMTDPSSLMAGGYADMEMRLVNGRFGGLSNQDLATAIYAERLQTIVLLERYRPSVQAALDESANSALVNAATAVLTLGFEGRLGRGSGSGSGALGLEGREPEAAGGGAGGATRPPVGNPTQEQLSTATSLGVDPRWVNSDGSIDWPPNGGFAGPPQNVMLQPGTRVDRYGSANGGYLSPAGTPFQERALPPSAVGSRYTSYEVVKPLPVNSGPAAPWFGQPGNGIQYQLQGVTIQQMIDDGYLKVVE